jgi:hypothetical protein
VPTPDSVSSAVGALLTENLRLLAIDEELRQRVARQLV